MSIPASRAAGTATSSDPAHAARPAAAPACAGEFDAVLEGVSVAVPVPVVLLLVVVVAIDPLLLPPVDEAAALLPVAVVMPDIEDIALDVELLFEFSPVRYGTQLVAISRLTFMRSSWSSFEQPRVQAASLLLAFMESLAVQTHSRLLLAESHCFFTAAMVSALQSLMQVGRSSKKSLPLV